MFSSEKILLPQDLKDSILGNKCVAFIGSGPSTGEYDSWPKLVDNLSIHCGSSSRVNHDSTTDELLDAAQSAKNASEEKYYECLGSHFGRPAQMSPLLFDALFKLPFKCYLTVNLDPLLALRCRTNGFLVRTYPNLDRLLMHSKSVHYLHGRIDEGTTPNAGSIVFARSEFDEAYRNNSNLMNLLVPTIENDPVVFIGCRLREPGFRKVFDICKVNQQVRQKLIAEQGLGIGSPPPRFIFLPKRQEVKLDGTLDEELSESATNEEDSYYEMMEITPIRYLALNGDHSAIRYALEQLAELPVISPNYGWEPDPTGAM